MYATYYYFTLLSQLATHASESRLLVLISFALWKAYLYVREGVVAMETTQSARMLYIPRISSGKAVHVESRRRDSLILLSLEGPASAALVDAGHVELEGPVAPSGISLLAVSSCSSSVSWISRCMGMIL